MKLTAYSQSSRFHTVDNKFNSIDLKDVNILSGERVLLLDAHIQLNSGVHYGLIGRNGTGKSVLLQCLASGKLLSPALRSQLRVMYLTQSLEDIPTTGSETVLDEIKRPPFGYNFQQSEVEKYRLIAEQVSGARGKRAREILLKLEQEAANEEEDEDPMMNEEFEELTFTDINPTVQQLGLSKKLQSNYSELSGGWKMRVQLAKALIHKPDLLFLDEPTNHLDISGVFWLESWIKDLQVTTIIVSHNRQFLNNTVTEIIWLKNKRLDFFKGNYDQFLQTISEKQLSAVNHQNALDKKKEKIENSISQNFKSAIKHGDDKKLKQVASKKTKLEERFGFERNAKGHRFKLNRDRIGHFDSKLGGVNFVDEEVSEKLKFQMEAILPRGSLLEAQDLFFERKDGNGVTFSLNNITLNVEAGERIAIIGANGQGKSTILNLLSKELQATRGDVRINTQNVGYFKQDVVTMLGNEHVIAIDRLCKLFSDDQQTLWNHLGSFGLGKVANNYLDELSGGQRVAYAFAELSYRKPALLLLDEPNSHLDLDAVEALEEALKEYQGGVIFVSHDLSFVMNVATSSYWVSKGTMQKLNDLSEISQLVKPKMIK